MPKLMDVTMDELKTASNYKFSAVKIDELGATEYTLVTIVQDVSGSVLQYRDEMEKCLKTILDSCKKSPRAENLLLRLMTFNTNIEEIHGFKLLNSIGDKDYEGILNPNGETALFDAAQSAVEATKNYGEILTGQDFGVNAIIFVVTDGEDNSSRTSPISVRRIIDDAAKSEQLEGVTVVLIGINNSNGNVSRYLQTFQQEANITQFVDIGETTPNKLAKLANFISRSISSTSQSLADGTSSTLLVF